MNESAVYTCSYCFHDCACTLSKQLKEAIQNIKKSYDEICVACIGTDRSTGDSLGPLVGYNLRYSGIKVIGTLDEPLHAGKLSEFYNSLNDRTLVLAVDASLGESVGCIKIKEGPLKPGSSLNKDLPPIGDISITGIVNRSGWMEFMVLQSTRLSLVMRMAEIISTVIKHVLTVEKALTQRIGGEI